MKRGCLIMCITLLITCYHLAGQDVDPVDKWRLFLEEMVEELDDEEAIESLYSELSYLSEHPFDLNRVTSEELQRLPFLSGAQIDSLLSFRQRYGRFETVYELKNIPLLDRETIALLLPFITIQEMAFRHRPLSLDRLFKEGKHEMILHYDRCLQEKRGYQPQSDSLWSRHPNRRYQGEPFHLSIRYGYTFDQRLQLGVVVEKDRGEPLFNRFHKGFDYSSAHLLFHDLWKIKSLAIGDYRASFGQGLVLSHDFLPGKMLFVTQGERRNNGFRRHYSTNEHDFFRGGATSFRWRHFHAHLFYSYRKMDGTVEGEKIRSFKRDGLHRLTSEREKKGAFPVQVMGVNLRYALPQWLVGVTALNVRYPGFMVDPKPVPSNRDAFRGGENFNLSVDYLFKRGGVKFFGESALSKSGGWATVDALQWTPASYINALILYRYYAKDYHASYGRAFSQSLHLHNEEGLFLSMQVKPLPHLKIMAYADFFRTPWMRRGVDAPSSGLEYMTQFDYAGWKSRTLYVRYRYKQREVNRLEEDGVEVAIRTNEQHRIRLQCTHAITRDLLLVSSLDGSFYQEEMGRLSRGWMVAQSVDWKPRRSPLQVNLYVAAFLTDSYFSRIYSYEKQLLYQFNRPSLYGKGGRLSTVVRLPLSKKISIFSKCGWTHLFDDTSLGSGLEAIEGRNRIDFYLMMRWVF